jgi:hypothetical protein
MFTGQIVDPPHGNAISVDGDTITFNPDNDFKPGETVQVIAASRIENPSGEASRQRVWSFRTGVSGGSGAFDDSGQVLGFCSSRRVALGDLDLDGDLDAFVANASNHANRVWNNDGSGNFTDSGQSLGNRRSYDVALGDLDGDGDLDAFVVHPDDQPARVWLNQDPPQVTGVLVSGTAWSPAFLDQIEAVGTGGTRGHAIPVGSGAQLDTINWGNADQLIIRFSAPVNVGQNDLVLSGVLGPDGVEDATDDYGFTNFITETGPTGAFQAVWTLGSPLAIDKLLIKLDVTTGSAVTDLAGNQLDGEWTDASSTYPSGDGAAGGDFEFEFHSRAARWTTAARWTPRTRPRWTRRLSPSPASAPTRSSTT